MDEEEFDEWYPQAKVYFDGSHYIAIPHTVNLSRRRKTHHEEIEVSQTGDKFELVKKPPTGLEETDENSPWDGEPRSRKLLSGVKTRRRAQMTRQYVETNR